MVKSTEPECKLCLEEDEMSLHIIALCPTLAKQTLYSLGTLFLEPPLKWSPEATQFLWDIMISLKDLDLIPLDSLE